MQRIPALLAPLFGVLLFFRSNPGVFAALDPRLPAGTPNRGAACLLRIEEAAPRRIAKQSVERRCHSSRGAVTISIFIG